jgi:hypothetical protein
MFKTILACSLFYLVSVIPAYSSSVELTNRYIRISVDEDTGRFTLEMARNDPDSDQRGYKPLLCRNNPSTSFTTVNINGKNCVYGGKDGNTVRKSYLDGDRIVTFWEADNLLLAQVLQIVPGPHSESENTMLVTYKVLNNSKQNCRVGIRMVLDVMNGDTKPRDFVAGGFMKFNSEKEFTAENMPTNWFTLNGMEEPDVRVEGTLMDERNTVPDRVVFAAWERFIDNPWTFPVQDGKRFVKTAGNGPGAAVALYYEPREIDAANSMSINTSFGVFDRSAVAVADKDGESAPQRP